MITVAPNGARKMPSEHASIPITPAQIAATAAACVNAGASMLHLHIRDKANQHSLDAALYQNAIRTIRHAVGARMIIQITTEAVGRYDPASQMQVVKAVRPEAVSLAVRELCPSAAEEETAAGFFHWLQQAHISPQYILYSVADILRLNELQARGIIPGDSVNVLLVLGRYSDQQQSNPHDLEPLLSVMNTSNPWSLCAFGASEAECMQLAIERGGHCRVGFENNLLMPDGSIAPNNEALVKVIAQRAAEAGRPVASAAQARAILGIS